uniref:Uncharacterized protein n=1 Tax=Rhizophora mucronata TaxID=61149 RepID=A0A2P2PJ22_RHIMU
MYTLLEETENLHYSLCIIIFRTENSCSYYKNSFNVCMYETCYLEWHNIIYEVHICFYGQ